MKRKRWIAMAAIVGVAAGAGGCQGNGGKYASKDVEKYLGAGGKLYGYLDRLSDAVCQLEVANPSGLDEDKRICPGGPGDKIKPPTYP